MKPALGPHDVHLVVNAGTGWLKCYGPDGRERWRCEARCHGADGPGTWVTGGDTPPGLYRCGSPLETSPAEPRRTWSAYGRWFVDLEEMEGQELARGRAGIGVHGGGSALPDPEAPRQGWAPTRGCVRLQNEDLETLLVPAVRWVRAHMGTAWLTVDGTE